MRLVFLGSGEFAIPTLESIHFDGHDIALVVTQPDKVRGRGKEVSPTPLKRAALEYNLPILATPDVNAPEVVEQLRALKADLAYVAAFGQKFGPAVMAAFPMGMINLHGSLLPALRGAAPIQWSIINGLAVTGVTVFRVVERMDAGAILTQRRTGINIDETADELHDRMARIGCDAVRAALADLAADPTRAGTPQDESQASFAPKLKKSDGRLVFDMPARRLADRIRGLWSWPGASCRFVSADGTRDETVTLARATPYEGRTSPAGSPEEIGRITEMMSVQTPDSELMILELKPAGGKLMSWRDFVNGRHVQAGDRLVSLDPVGAH